MLIFAAYNGGWPVNTLASMAWPNVLVSFTSGWNLGKLASKSDAYMPERIFTDSGAYTAWQNGDEIDLGDYIEWCRAYRAAPELPPAVHISLDVIPGQRGVDPTEAERDEGIARSLANGEAMREAGLPIMEVYHQYEPRSLLDQLLARRVAGEVVGLSPRQGQGHAAREVWLDGVFAYLLEHYDRQALPPLHGLGIGSRDFAFRYPWFSIDSSAYVSAGSYGRRKGGTGGTTIDNRVHGREGLYVLEAMNVLRTWAKWEGEATAVWAERGVAWVT